MDWVDCFWRLKKILPGKGNLVWKKEGNFKIFLPIFLVLYLDGITWAWLAWQAKGVTLKNGAKLNIEDCPYLFTSLLKSLMKFRNCDYYGAYCTYQ